MLNDAAGCAERISVVEGDYEDTPLPGSSYDGVYALEQLNDSEGPLPDLILLDLNLPRMDGRELLAEIKREPKLAPIPVVVLTTSDADADVLRSYELHANAFVTKPRDLNRFLNVVREIDRFFVTIAKLPGHASA